MHIFFYGQIQNNIYDPCFKVGQYARKLHVIKMHDVTTFIIYYSQLKTRGVVR